MPQSSESMIFLAMINLMIHRRVRTRRHHAFSHTLLVLILLRLPLYDRNSRVNPRKRPAAMIGGLILVLGVVALTVLGYYANPSAYGAKPKADPNVSGLTVPAQQDPQPSPASDANLSAAPAGLRLRFETRKRTTCNPSCRLTLLSARSRGRN